MQSSLRAHGGVDDGSDGLGVLGSVDLGDQNTCHTLLQDLINSLLPLGVNGQIDVVSCLRDNDRVLVQLQNLLPL